VQLGFVPPGVGHFLLGSFFRFKPSKLRCVGMNQLWDEELMKAATAVRANAYAPYSNFFVGAALRLKDGRIVPGANVENSSYPLSVCAERSAISAAVAMGVRPGDVQSVAVVTEAPALAAPCGGCRQVLNEFMSKDAPIFVLNLKDQKKVTFTISALLPEAFGPSFLGK